jgi:ubiquinol-cytochrome c reductase iron-sulfur subunit
LIETLDWTAFRFDDKRRRSEEPAFRGLFRPVSARHPGLAAAPSLPGFVRGFALADTRTYPITASPEAREREAPEVPHATRRDFLLIATGAFAAVGAAAVAWPFIDQMNPDASALALASIEVDVSSMQPGQSITVMWRGKPVFIRYRTEAEVEAAKAVPLSELRDPAARNLNIPENAPATDENRAVPEHEQWLVMVGVCTHLGCVPLGQQGNFGGWFCPCHGSHYDTAGRIRQGPAPENLPVPPLAFVNDTTIRIG